MGGSASWGDGWRRELAGWEAARVGGMGGSASLRDGRQLEFAGWEAARVGGMGGGESWRDGRQRELGDCLIHLLVRLIILTPTLLIHFNHLTFTPAYYSNLNVSQPSYLWLVRIVLTYVIRS